MKIVLKLFLSIVLLSFLGCSSKNELFNTNTKTKTNIVSMPQRLAPQSLYTIAPHDRLSIFFYKYPELSTTTKNSFKDDLGVEVSNDGTIILPIIKRIRVSGLTKQQLQNLLYQRYSLYLTDSSLKVEILNRRVYVMGEVKNPGTLDLNSYKRITPLKAIIKRGGLTNYANIHSIKVLRGNRQNYRLLNIDLSNVASVRTNNITLVANDIVYVSHNRAKDFNMPINGVGPSLNIINTILNSISTFR